MKFCALLLSHTKVNLASENYGETSATAKENRENSDFNHGEQHQATGLYVFSRQCLLDRSYQDYAAGPQGQRPLHRYETLCSP